MGWLAVKSGRVAKKKCSPVKIKPEMPESEMNDVGFGLGELEDDEIANEV